MSQKLETQAGNAPQNEQITDVVKMAELPKSKSLPIVKAAQERTEGVKLEVISNEDFLKVYPNISDRFAKLTNPSLKGNEIKAGNNINITFTHNGVFNKELYLNTTAGQTLPAQIRSVNVKGEIYTRLHNSINGEFYNANNKRLTIHEGSKLGIENMISQEELTQLETVDTNLEGIEREIYTVAMRKGVDADVLKLVAMHNIKNISDTQKRSVELELYATEISRNLSREKVTKGEKYSLNLSAKIFKNMLPAGWESSLETYGYEKGEIAEYVENNYFARNIFGLGSLSAEYESGSRGAYAYNPDDNDTGYPSYGTYQMHRDTFDDFCEKHNINPQNKEGWDNAVKLVGLKEFQRKEHEFIKETHYDVMMNQITLVGASQFSLVLKNVIWSTAVQHGGNKSSIISLINNFTDFIPGDTQSEKELIENIYAKRMGLFPAGASRYKNEMRTALRQLNNSLPYELSSPIEISESGTTLCSKTARLNLEKLGIQAPRGASAFDSMRLYPEARLATLGHIPTDANAIDIFSSALNPKNSSYGHRAVAFKTSGNWFVLDPYTRTPGREGWSREQLRKPIPLDDYSAKRNIHGVVYHSVENDMYV